MIIRTALALALFATASACGTPTHRDPGGPAYSAEAVVAESTRLNAWFEQKFDEDVARDPMRQTYLGIKDRYGEWTDPSDAFERAELDFQRANVAEMKANFDFDKLDHQTQLSWRLAEYQLERAEAAFPFRGHDYTFNQMFGIQSGIPAFLINQHKVATPSDAEAYIARLEGVRDYLGQHVANAREAAAKGIQPPAFVYDYVLSDARGVITGYPFSGTGDGSDDSPLMADFREKTAALATSGALTEEAADALNARAADALKASVGPAYEAAIEELARQQLNANADDGAWKLPDGEAYYNMRLAQMTTTGMTAEEIHQLGLDEVARIQDEMKAIMAEVGFDGSLKDFFEFMRTDPRFYKPNTPEGKAAYLAEAEAAIARMKGDLPKLFNTFPKADLEVKAVEAFREKSAGKAFYSRPAPDGSRPGTYYANLYDMVDMPTYQLEALAFHEGIPGHHMQIAIAQELEGIPSFRKYGGYTAYSEGWGLYSELAPKEMGYYADPYSDFGRLAMEIWRAARLVVDTGIHSRKWTREQAVQYLIDNTPNPQGDCEKAIDRYIVMPGQATAYKIGMLKIVELRERARAQLGDAFDIREFHDIVLRDGAVPLAVLEETVDAWLASKKT
ncbi:DUF885 domain-containing protein [Hyphomonas sp.]|uniref:DUF885 domain-containing protein n=1 Tax=Hyphomonas sp. TaxID=87 RepID=UPI001D1F1934|nr:DUF885 domain-containing protein [Hyphomonas sp.]MBU4060817.1 DUF885 domain-containing protein [Alphaproteobacteria bacterium]MBU4164801.1 DUF885 domain-containing protein [Alphaproteobacteria bacterium]